MVSYGFLRSIVPQSMSPFCFVTSFGIRFKKACPQAACRVLQMGKRPPYTQMLLQGIMLWQRLRYRLISISVLRSVVIMIALDRAALRGWPRSSHEHSCTMIAHARYLWVSRDKCTRLLTSFMISCCSEVANRDHTKESESCDSFKAWKEKRK